MRLVIVILCIFALALLAVGKVTHTDYMFESENQFAGDPGDYITHYANGWAFVKDMPIVGEYQRYQGSDESGTVFVEASGKISEDYAEGNFYGTITLTLNEKNMTCAGRFRGKRHEYIETLHYILHCPDGSKIQERAEFAVATPTWTLLGNGRLLEPHGD